MPAITRPLAGRIVVRVPFRADMRRRLRSCGGEPRWDPETGVWTMPRGTLDAVVAAVAVLHPDLRVDLELAAGHWHRTDAGDPLALSA